MPLSLPNDIANEQDADGDKLQQNFVTIEDWANQEAVTRDGSTAMTSPLLLPGAPTEPNQAATKAYVDAAVLIGEVKMWPGTNEPPGYFFCRGAAISRATYAALFAVLGTAYGAGDGSTTFNLPDYRGRSPVGVNSQGQFFSGGPGELGGSGNTILPYHGHGVNIWSQGENRDHVHDMNFYSGLGTANHRHGLDGGAEYLAASWSAVAFIDAHDGGGAIGYVQSGATSEAGADHAHHVNGWTNGRNQGHEHAINGNSDPAGTGETGYSNYHPLQTINFIIKVI